MPSAPGHPRVLASFAGGALALPLAALGSDLALVAYFALAEALAVFSTLAIVALERYNRGRILEWVEPRHRREWALKHLERVGVYDLSVRLLRFLANSLLVIGIAWQALRDDLGRGDAIDRVPWGILAGAVAVAFAVTFLVNDVFVRLLGRRRPNRFLVRFFPVLRALQVLTAPVRIPTALLAWIVFRVRLETPGPGPREETRQVIAEGEREGAFTAAEADQLEAVLDLRNRFVGEILTVRGEAQMLRADAPVAEAVALAHRTGHSRFPVYGRDKDEVIGYVNVRDLLAYWGRPDGGARARDVTRPPFFVPDTKPVGELLQEMRKRRIHLAIVTDEYGGTGGLVTIEDILEAIVGPIADEYDKETLQGAVQQARAGLLVVDGRTPIEDVNRALSVTLPIEEHFETVGGLVLHRLGKVPRTGERLTLDNVALTVTEADERVVKRLQVQLMPEASASSPGS
jgi:CBS domain containing-hemolysin-like protein